MSAQKSVPLTKEEVMQLVNLVEANPVVYSKATNASNNQLKETAWSTITDSFNSMIASTPRKPEQLRLKWENLKKAARKRSARIRMNNLKTGGGKPDYIPPDESLEKVASILGPTCDGYSVQFGGDAVVAEVIDGGDREMVQDYTVVDILPVENIPPHPPVNVSPALVSPHTPKSKFFFSSVGSKGKLRRQTIAEDLKTSAGERNKIMAEYYHSRRKWDEEIHVLKKRKLELINIQNELINRKLELELQALENKTIN